MYLFTAACAAWLAEDPLTLLGLLLFLYYAALLLDEAIICSLRCLSSSCSSLFLCLNSSHCLVSRSICALALTSLALASSWTLCSSLLRNSISSLYFLLLVCTNYIFFCLCSNAFFSFLSFSSSSFLSLSRSSNSFFFFPSKSRKSTRCLDTRDSYSRFIFCAASVYWL